MRSSCVLTARTDSTLRFYDTLFFSWIVFLFLCFTTFHDHLLVSYNTVYVHSPYHTYVTTYLDIRSSGQYAQAIDQTFVTTITA